MASGGAGAQPLHVQADGLLGVDDSFRGEGRVVTPGEVGEATAKSSSARKSVHVGVMDHGDLEPGPGGIYPRGEVADIGQIGERVGETQPQALRITIASPSPSSRKADGFGTRIQAGHHVDRVFRDDAGPLAGVHGREVLVALRSGSMWAIGRVLPVGSCGQPLNRKASRSWPVRVAGTRARWRRELTSSLRNTLRR